MFSFNNKGNEQDKNIIREGLPMKNKLAFTTVALGAAYLMRNKEARQKLKQQFQSFSKSKR